MVRLGSCAADIGPPRLFSWIPSGRGTFRGVKGKRYIRFTHDREQCYGTSDERSPSLMSESCLASIFYVSALVAEKLD